MNSNTFDITENDLQNLTQPINDITMRTDEEYMGFNEVSLTDIDVNDCFMGVF